MKNAKLILAATLALTLGACGGNDAPAPEAAKPAPAPQASAPAPAPAPAAGGGEGEKVYKKVCALCHSSGVAGAPIPGNKADWDARIAQGEDVLYKHAIEGFTGEKGMMPPRGGGSNLTDDEVKAGVDYMVGKLK
ncbi:c-type cytochrome [Nitrogeniibacter aestuarii]|uniref:c-type cytochrome n=1 Tax=Nitrogeniibacter aestuarii TaxID=2815343 RepID=UPI001E2A059C|nr:c-type cytochrome [Nitrogeniibacter aestuarii]